VVRHNWHEGIWRDSERKFHVVIIKKAHGLESLPQGIATLKLSRASGSLFNIEARRVFMPSLYVSGIGAYFPLQCRHQEVRRKLDYRIELARARETSCKGG
jgi:hypothetical protein